MRPNALRCDAIDGLYRSEPAWAGTRHRSKYLARQLGPGAGSRSARWRMHYWAGVLERLEGPKIKNQKSRPMIAWEVMDARKRAELLLPCVCAGAGAENLKAAIELGQAGSDNKYE